MNNINISLPESVGQFVDIQVKQKGYNSVSDYLLDLIIQDQQAQEQKQLENMLKEGTDSGKPLEINHDWWENKRQQLQNQHK